MPDYTYCLDNIERRIFLKTLQEIDKLSGRAFSLCTNTKLYTLWDIKLFYKDYGNFFKFKNCGEIINNELCLLCEIELNMSSLILKPVLFILDKYDMLLPKQKSRLHDFLVSVLSFWRKTSVGCLVSISQPSFQLEFA